MKNSDIKIRFSGEHAETWLKHCIPHMLEFDWGKQAIGARQFHALGFLVNGKKVAQVAFYKTKTLRVVFISAKEEFPNSNNNRK